MATRAQYLATAQGKFLGGSSHTCSLACVVIYLAVPQPLQSPTTCRVGVTCNLANTAFYCKLRTMFDNRAKQVIGWQLTYVLSDMCGDMTCRPPAPAKPNDVLSRRDVKRGKYCILWQTAHNV